MAEMCSKRQLLCLAAVAFALCTLQCESFAAVPQHRGVAGRIARCSPLARPLLAQMQAATASTSGLQPQPSQAMRARLTLGKKERVQKLLAQAGVCSRREAEKLILDGRVTVNGYMVKTLGSKANPANDVIKVDNERVFVRSEEDVVWIAYHKPAGVVCSMQDEQKKFTVAEAIPRAKELRLLPVGRLDKDSTGLLLLTNDNAWIHVLTHPAFGHRKRYHVTVGNGCPTEEEIKPIRRGLKVPSEKTAYQPAAVTLLEYDDETAKLEVLLTEGRNRQIRRMFEHIGHPVLRLKRVEFGPIKLGKLKRGDWRFLTAAEITKLKQGARDKLKEAKQQRLAPAKPATPASNAPDRSRTASTATKQKAPSKPKSSSSSSKPGSSKN